MKKQKIKIKLNVSKEIKSISRDVYQIPVTKKFKDKTKYNRKNKHKGEYYEKC